LFQGVFSQEMIPGYLIQEFFTGSVSRVFVPERFLQEVFHENESTALVRNP
jgi:hypothetical protein